MQDTHDDRQPDPATGKGVAVGLGLTLLLHIGGAMLVFALAAIYGEAALIIGLVAAAALGLAQVVYMLPSILIARRLGKMGVAKGLMIGAGITALLNTACWGMVGMGSIFPF